MFFFLFQLFFVLRFSKPKLIYQDLLESLRKQQLRGVLLNIYVFNLINFTKLCSLLATFVNTQETFQRGLNVVVRGDMASRSGTMSNQRWNNVVYVNIAIYNVEQRQINALYFNVYINNVRKRRSNVFIFNPEFHNVDQRRNNVVNVAIFKKLKRVKKIFLSLKKDSFD